MPKEGRRVGRKNNNKDNPLTLSFVSVKPWCRGMREEALRDIKNYYNPGKLTGDN